MAENDDLILEVTKGLERGDFDAATAQEFLDQLTAPEPELPETTDVTPSGPQPARGGDVSELIEGVRPQVLDFLGAPIRPIEAIAQPLARGQQAIQDLPGVALDPLERFLAQPGAFEPDFRAPQDEIRAPIAQTFETAGIAALDATREAMLPTPGKVPAGLGVLATQLAVPQTPLDLGLLAFGVGKVGTALFKKLGKKGTPLLPGMLEQEIEGVVTQASREDVARWFDDMVIHPETTEQLIAGLKAGGEAEALLPGLTKATQMNRALLEDVIRTMRSGKKLPVDSSLRTADQLALLVQGGQLRPEEAASLIGLRPVQEAEEFAKVFRQSASQLGKGMNFLSRISRELGGIPKFAGSKVIQEASTAANKNAWMKFMQKYRTLENFRKKMLIAQVATASRNFSSQGVRYGVDVVERAGIGLTMAMTGQKGAAKRGFEEAFTEIAVAMGNSPNQKKFLDVLDKKFPHLSTRLFNAPVMDAVMGQGMADKINVLNTMQENYFRRIAFDTSIQSQLKKQGLTIGGINKMSFEAQEKMFSEAVSKALNVTFAENLDTAHGLLKESYRVLPLELFGFTPFPRFWANSMKFLMEFSPASTMRPESLKVLNKMVENHLPTLIGKPTRKLQVGLAGVKGKGKTIADFMAKPITEKEAQIFTRSMIGNSMMAVGMAVDEMGWTGGKWFELKNPETGRVFDMRAFAPWSFYLFAGKMINRVRKNGMEAFLEVPDKEYVEALTSLNRTGNVGMPFDRWAGSLKDDSKSAMLKNVNGFTRQIGQWAGGFTVPARTVLDVASEVFPIEAIPRTTRLDDPLATLLAPAAANIPFLQGLIPKSQHPLREGDTPRERPLLGQITGLRSKIKTPVEFEVDKHGLDGRTIYPQGFSEAKKRAIIGFMGPVADDVLTTIINSPIYKDPKTIDKRAKTFKVRQILLKTWLGRIKKDATKAAEASNSKFAFEAAFRTMDDLSLAVMGITSLDDLKAYLDELNAGQEKQK